MGHPLEDLRPYGSAPSIPSEVRAHAVQACARRNVHGFTLEAVTEMARRWEPLPPQYLQLDVQVRTATQPNRARHLSLEAGLPGRAVALWQGCLCEVSGAEQAWVLKLALHGKVGLTPIRGSRLRA